MFDGKTFLPVTGMPIRKMACMMRPFALAEPVPLAVAILKAKSLTRSITGKPLRSCRYRAAAAGVSTLLACGHDSTNLRMSHA